jgi:protein-S-isoprenylcysteine O-methyltransferase Ste14
MPADRPAGCRRSEGWRGLRMTNQCDTLPGMNENRPDTPRILAPPPLLFFACLLAGWLLGLLWPFQPFEIGFAARLIAGSVLYGVALVLAVSALLIMHRHQTPAEPWKPTTQIVNTGPFRFTRNPIYVALVLVLAAIAIQTASGWLMLFVPVLFLLLDRGVVRAEERYLSTKFGEDYLAYMRQVRRWI